MLNMLNHFLRKASNAQDRPPISLDSFGGHWWILLVVIRFGYGSSPKAGCFTIKHTSVFCLQSSDFRCWLMLMVWVDDLSHWCTCMYMFDLMFFGVLHMMFHADTHGLITKKASWWTQVTVKHRDSLVFDHVCFGSKVPYICLVYTSISDTPYPLFNG